MTKFRNRILKDYIRSFRSLISLIRTVKNWYVPLFMYIFPFGDVNREVTVECRNGLKYILRPKKLGDLVIFVEIIGKNIYTSHFSIVGTIVDIGAHIGIFSVLAGKTGNHVYAYEPFPSNFKLLKKNIEINSLTNVKAFQKAVGSKMGVRSLFIDAKFSGGHSLYPFEGHPFNGSIKCQTTTLEDIFVSNDLERINFLKIDCEGAEYEILLNTPKRFLHRIDKIVIECHGGSGMRIADLLRNSKFDVTYDRETSTLYAVSKNNL